MNELKKIEGTGKQGDFVLSNQKLATAEGFGHVSKIWYDKTMSYDKGLEQLAADKKRTVDVMASFADIKPTLNKDGNFVLKSAAGQEYGLTQHSIMQLGYLAGTGFNYPSKLYFDKRDSGDSETLVKIISNGLRFIEKDKKFLFRVRDGNTLRAILTNRYAIIDNEWVISSLKALIPSGRLSHWRGDSDTIYGNVLIPDTIREDKDSDYGGMLSLSNCEIGLRRLSTTPSVFRAICMNGCIWDQQRGSAYEKVHRGKINYQELFEQLKTNLVKQIPLLPQGIDKLLMTRLLTWDKTVSEINIFAAAAQEFKLTQKQAMTNLLCFKQFEEEHRSLFGLVNSFTRAGQILTPAEWVSFDEFGGKLINYDQNKWASFLNRAKSLKAEEIATALGV